MSSCRRKCGLPLPELVVPLCRKVLVGSTRENQCQKGKMIICLKIFFVVAYYITIYVLTELRSRVKR